MAARFYPQAFIPIIWNLQSSYCSSVLVVADEIMIWRSKVQEPNTKCIKKFWTPAQTSKMESLSRHLENQYQISIAPVSLIDPACTFVKPKYRAATYQRTSWVPETRADETGTNVQGSYQPNHYAGDSYTQKTDEGAVTVLYFWNVLEVEIWILVFIWDFYAWDF